MPPAASILTARPSDTAIPGLARRRVWAAPAVTSHSLLVLTLPRLYLTPPGGMPKPEFIAAVEAATDVAAAVGPFATAVNLPDITRVRLNLLANQLIVDYPVSGRPARVAIGFIDAETADAVFSKLWRRLGVGYELVANRPAGWAAARGPALAAAGVLVAAAISAVGLNALADVAAANRTEWAGRLPGWPAVCVAAGVVAAGLTVWAHRRFTTPPDRLELVRTGGPFGAA